jgi:hypothetical protein
MASASGHGARAASSTAAWSVSPRLSRVLGFLGAVAEVFAQIQSMLVQANAWVW